MHSFRIASVDSVIIYFGHGIGASKAREVRHIFYALEKAKLKYVGEIVPSYNSIMLSYDFLQTNYKNICKAIDEVIDHADEFYEEISSRTMYIPVYYGLEVGLDLEELSKEKSLSIEEIIDLHTKKEYFVYAIGFSPGFAYMGEVDDALVAPRLSNPRAKVPKGSVGIAQKQTAVYPQLSPGGWRILGRTPIEMFDTSYEGFSYLRVGDKVRFDSVTKEEFLELGGEI